MGAPYGSASFTKQLLKHGAASLFLFNHNSLRSTEGNALTCDLICMVSICYETFKIRWDCYTNYLPIEHAYMHVMHIEHFFAVHEWKLLLHNCLLYYIFISESLRKIEKLGSFTLFKTLLHHSRSHTNLSGVIDSYKLHTILKLSPRSFPTLYSSSCQDWEWQILITLQRTG